MVKQTVRNLHMRRSPALMLKLDVAKAFDSVSWLFFVLGFATEGFWGTLAGSDRRHAINFIHEGFGEWECGRPVLACERALARRSQLANVLHLGN